MSTMPSALLERCAGLDARRRLLADRLGQAARAMDECRILPATSLAEDLAAYADEYRLVSAAAGVAADVTLGELRDQLVVTERRRQGLAQLQCCLDVISSDGPALLDPLHNLVREARSQLQDRAIDANGLLVRIEAGTHPALRLWRLVARPESLSDEEWQSTLNDIKAAFGSPLAVAAARGRLSIRDSSEPVALK